MHETPLYPSYPPRQPALFISGINNG